MRLLQLRFKNLNSLTGEWAIDLTQPAYVADGLFAITGPTGAGKSTILDAICLALYGRTPRLDKITKGGNEIMSRQTGECFAEVAFETARGRYRCHWSQHRARKRPDGELQSPRHEIADAETGKLIEHRVRAAGEQIEAATGMNFERFTRSMLLAQNGFAAFLQSRADERAPILEQITGAGIYTEISVRVHQRRADEQRTLDGLSAALNGIQPLSAEEIGQLDQDLARKDQESNGLGVQIEGLNHALDWLEGIQRLEQELEALATRKADWQSRNQAFAGDRVRLQRAARALEAAGEHAALDALRESQQETDRALTEVEAALPAAEAEARQTEAALGAADERLTAERAARERAEPEIRQARALDLRLREKAAPLTAAEAALTARQHRLNALQAAHRADSARLAEARNRVEALSQALAETSADGALVEQLGAIRARFEGVQRHSAERVSAATARESGAIRLAEADANEKARTAELDRQRQAQKILQDDLEKHRTQWRTLLEDLSLNQWRARRHALKERRTALDDWARALADLEKSREALGDLQQTRQAQRSRLEGLGQALEQQTERTAAKEREAELLETQLALLNRIQGFEAARDQLQDDEPCPLCGAREHPYAAGNTPAPDAASKALQQARSDLNTAREGLADLRVARAEAQKDCHQTEERIREQETLRNAAEGRIAEFSADLDLDPAGDDHPQTAARMGRENQAALTRVESIVEAAEALEEGLVERQTAFDGAREALTQAEQAVQQARYGQQAAAAELERAVDQIERLNAQWEQARAEAGRLVAPFGVAELPAERLEGLLHELTERRDQWLARSHERTAVEGGIAGLVERTRHQQTQIAAEETELGEQQARLEALRQEREVLRRERRGILGGRDPDQEEQRQAAAVLAAEQNLETARRNAANATTTKVRLRDRREALQSARSERQQRLASAGPAFTARLQTLGFTSEAEYLAARLPEDERHRLAAQQQALEAEQAELTSRERELRQRLAAERAKTVSAEPPDALKQELTRLQVRQKELHQEAGAIRQRLAEDARLRERRAEQTRAIEAQQRECARWELLHDLIGSADGKKYRNFAQGLTFELMIAQANRQLQKMSDRYLLIHDEQRPLELNVIDNYQAGEIRSTKNLSGGESFIVSLALALGLSQMASRNVRVDSLFLDEGFGALDEEALDTALETLAGLQQDGKLIGVISHVPALKERIATQIQVRPGTGGRSVISGPGCERVTHPSKD